MNVAGIALDDLQISRTTGTVHACIVQYQLVAVHSHSFWHIVIYTTGIILFALFCTLSETYISHFLKGVCQNNNNPNRISPRRSTKVGIDMQTVCRKFRFINPNIIYVYFFVHMFFICILSLTFTPISLILSSIASFKHKTSSGRS